MLTSTPNELKPPRKVADRTTMDQYVLIRDFFNANIVMQANGYGTFSYPEGYSDASVATMVVRDNPGSNVTKAHVRFVRGRLGYKIRQVVQAPPKKEELAVRVSRLEEALQNHVRHAIRLEVQLNELAARLGETV